MSPSAVLRTGIVAASLLLTGGCGFEPAGDVPMKAPLLYRTWWARTEACSGRSGDFDRVQWFVVDGPGFACPGGTCAGRWDSTHRIYLAGDWRNNEMVVRHEMLHELLGRPGHPDPPFGAECPLTWSTWNGDRAALDDSPGRPDTLRID